MDNDYSTTDLGLTAALVTVGHQLTSMTKEMGQRRFAQREIARFHFEGTDQLKNDVESFDKGTLQVSAREFWKNARVLKSRIYDDILKEKIGA